MHTKLHSCAQGYATGPPTDISTGAGKRPPRRPDAISERRGDGKGSPRSKAMRTAGGGAVSLSALRTPQAGDRAAIDRARDGILDGSRRYYA